VFERHPSLDKRRAEGKKIRGKKKISKKNTEGGRGAGAETADHPSNLAKGVTHLRRAVMTGLVVQSGDIAGHPRRDWRLFEM
jgi:hypothetical protein